MSARHLQATKPIPSAGYKSVGAIIVTTLAFDRAPNQSTNLHVSGTSSEGADGPEQQHGTASTRRPEASNPSPRETVTLEENPLTKTLMRVSHTLAPLDDHKSSQEKASTPCHSDPVESERPPCAQPRKPREYELLDLLAPLDTAVVRRDFREARLRLSEAQSEKSIQLKIPPFLHPENQLHVFKEYQTNEVQVLIQAKGLEKALRVVRESFQPGEYEKHLYCLLRQQMFEACSRDGKLGHYPVACVYAKEVQKWCASIFDATVRRVKFSIEAASGQSWEGGDKQLQDEILKAHDWLNTYVRAEPKLREAVKTIKKELSKKALRQWTEYEKKHSLNSPVKTKNLDDRSRSMVSLSQNTHFISWYLRRPKFLLHKRNLIIEAIEAIEEDSSFVVGVLKNLYVQDLAAFEKTWRSIDAEQFHRYVTVPQEEESSKD
eukprot:Blabericola_migrator_1__6649@NODE_3357_length_1833_cov_36_507928_g2093_i0_p1_GENE_NODE_3357_length_1833_cov_36_507928_g2093_i0NODE_3357_length_1833_cov_36_507928_g2093_i0_p1_ORF_typecomplete_len434_score62_40Spo0A_C/PF08769_11/4_1Spo0A_C/PF08769_11/1_4e03Spo0A_C/PF08769_11/69Spo0A_C/PF08769_11/8_4e02_NODE_3357_length_1833_cov_36_507928_g2093_i0131314